MNTDKVMNEASIRITAREILLKIDELKKTNQDILILLDLEKQIKHLVKLCINEKINIFID